MRTPLFTLILLLTGTVNAQLNESFDDGNFTANPAWTGTTTTFTINSSKELQTSNTVSDTSWLATPHGFTTLDDKEWRFRIRLAFSPSGNNFSRVFLTSSTDLSTPGDGFFLQFGEAGSLDAIRLRKIIGGVETEICAGPAGQIASTFNISVRVVRNALGEWSLYGDPDAGTDYTLLATGTDATSITGAWFGFIATYTSSNATKFRYDDIYAGPEIVDAQPPALLSVTPVSATALDLLFDEPLASTAITDPANFQLLPAGQINTATQDAENAAIVHLTLTAPLANGQNYTLTIAEAADLTGNVSSNLTGDFNYLVNDVPQKGDVIISEFLCDPSPSIGLPEMEFVEIYNKSPRYFDLTGWKLGDGSSNGTILSGWIAPGEYKVLCAISSQSFYPGSYIVTSFPSLNNAADKIVLKTPELLNIDQLSYTDLWYGDEIKREGGYSLELINPNDPCSDASNWKGSNAFDGGTPGLQNSIFSDQPDAEPPFLTSALALSENVVQLRFSEGMDSLSLASALFNASPLLTLDAMTISSMYTDSVRLNFSTPLQSSRIYTFTYGPVADCWMNVAAVQGSFALPAQAEAGDLIINELLFDPSTGGSDFVELYNRSEKILNLRGFLLANQEDGSFASYSGVSQDKLLLPGDYVVVTPDAAFVQETFPQTLTEKLYEMQLPAFNNDSSTVALLLPDSTVCDLVAYNEDWHLSLIDNKENKTLERIDPFGTSNTSSNWHTAAETSGFGTPGGINSQYQVSQSDGEFGSETALFSPDNDGFEDVLMLYYTLPEGEMIGTITIYDDYGRVVRNLKRSELLSPKGSFTWDGTTDKGLKANIGIYMAVMEAFSVAGNANFSKRIAFTLAGKLD